MQAPAPTSVIGEVLAFWRQQPDKVGFLVLLAGWVALFHLFGNATFGFIHTSSMFGWLWYVGTTSPDDQHCLLVPLVVIALLYWKRKDLQAVPKAPWWPALVIVGGSLALHVAGFLVQQTRVSIVAFVVGLYGLTGLVWGWRWLQATFFPMFLLGFCVPLGTMAEPLTFPLRLLVSGISVGIAKVVLGINVIQDGVQIFNGQRTYHYEVAAACSGIRSLISLLALTTIYGFVSFRTWGKRLLMVGSAFPLAVIGNVLRLTAVIVISEAFGQKWGEYVETNLGFLTFGVALAGVLGLGSWLRARERRKQPPAESADACRADSQPGEWRPEPQDGGHPATQDTAPVLRSPLLAVKWAALGAAVLMFCGAGWMLARAQQSHRLGVPGLKMIAQDVHDETGKVIATNTVDLPAQVLQYKSQPGPITLNELGWLPKDTTWARRVYEDDKLGILASVVMMGTDRGSIHKPQICLVGQGWTITRSELQWIPMSEPYAYELPVMRLYAAKQLKSPTGQPSTVSAVYVYWFVADKQITARHGERMWWMARDLLRFGVLQRWAYVSCFTPCPPGQEAATYERIRSFLQAAVPRFQLAAGKPLPAVAAQSGTLQPGP